MKMKLLLLAALSLLALSLLGLPAAAQFNPVGSACQDPIAKTSPTCQQNQTQNGKKTNPAIDIIRTATNIIAVIAGVGAVVVVIISGFMFVTAGGATPGQRAGDPNRVKSARAALVGAIIGLIVIALAWTAVTFVTKALIKT
jgi:hypothetical protein